MNKSANRSSWVISLLLMFCLIFMTCLTGCGENAGDSGTKTTSSTTTTATAASISLGTDAVSVKSDNSNGATITATVLDAANSIIQGITVAFTATGGSLSASSVTTDAQGQAKVTFRSGTVNQSNQVVTITATASGISTQIPIQVVGSTLTMTSTTANLPSDGSVTATLSTIARNAGNVTIRDATINLTVSGAGNVSLSAPTGTTDINGKLRDAAGNEVTVKGTRAGGATVTANGLGTTATFDYTVTGPAAAVFGISSPTADPVTQVTNTPLTVTVTAPAPTANVTFSTTIGAWDGILPARSVVTKLVGAGGTVTATIQSDLAGFATVQVYDSAVPSTKDSVGVAFYAPATSAAKLSLQSGVSVLGLSTGGVSRTTTLTAKVLTTDNQPVGDAPVAFTIANPTGGGESISPVVAYTAANGQATATFTSGSVSSGAEGVTINARVVDPVVNADRPISIVIGGTAGSVVIGYGSEIGATTTTYTLPMSVLVADSSGSAVAGAAVSLKLWPVQYSSGTWYNSLAYDPANPDKVLYKPYVTGTFNNDDINENLIKDPTEQSDPNGALRPPNSAAGALPAMVTTGANGVANFDLVYLKGSAGWIRNRVRATTLVLGTETSASITFDLPLLKTEADAGYLPRTSSHPIDLTVTAVAGSTVSYTLPAWISPYGATTYATSSPYSAIVTATRVYTFTAPVGVTAGTVYEASVTAHDGGSTSARADIRIKAQ